MKKGRLPFDVPSIDFNRFRNLNIPTFHGAFNTLVISEILAGKIFSLNTDADSIRKYEDTFRVSLFADIPHPDSPDIRQVWEPARLQHITILLLGSAQGASCADPNRLRAFAKDALLGWIEKHPFLTGPHYLSAMECGLRIPVFFYGLKLLDDLSDNEVRRILRTIYEHAWWVSRRLSLFTSLGNHTVCECVGLVFGGAVFRGVAEGKAWLEKGVELLRQELHHQILDDGGPAEQSLAYHRFVLDLYWLAINFLESNGLHNCTDFKTRLSLGEEFFETFRINPELFPVIGDSDDGHAVAPGIRPVRPHGG